MYFLHYKVQPTLLVCHTCDNTVCVNPEHLFQGDEFDNAQDKVRKGRWSKGDRRVVPPHLVELFRYKYHHDRQPILSIAKEYGFCETIVGNIIYQRKGYEK